jgi:rare lipoprotein A
MPAIGIEQAAAAAFVALLIAFAASAQAGDGAHRLSGIAAYYDRDYKGRTADGRRYDPSRFTAAHKTLPFGTRLRVTEIRSGRSVEVVVTDRGPFTRGRVLDLSLAAAKQLGIIERGITRVTASVIRR